jgi:hypothetical protein
LNILLLLVAVVAFKVLQVAEAVVLVDIERRQDFLLLLVLR